MASGGGKREKTGDFYAVLGLNKDCSEAELRNAYKKLAMVILLGFVNWELVILSKGNSKFVEEAKEKFQVIHEAYSVLSDSNKRLLYDVGVYDSDDDENDMGDFLGEMVQMMSQTKPNENGQESFEELQQLFVEIFQSDLDGGFGGPSSSHETNGYDRFWAWTSSCNGNNGSNKRDNSAMYSIKTGTGDFNSGSGGAFCSGSNGLGDSSKGSGSSGINNNSNSSSKRRNGRKQKVSSFF